MNEITDSSIALAKFMNEGYLNKTDKSYLMVFKNNNELLVALRDLFFGFELDDNQKQLLASLNNPGTIKVLRKVLLPEITKDIPPGRTMDYWKTKDIGEAQPETFDRIVKEKQLLLEMLEQSLARLADNSLPAVDLTPQMDLSFLTARNNYMDLVDSKIREILLKVYEKEETIEEALTKMRKNSSK